MKMKIRDRFHDPLSSKPQRPVRLFGLLTLIIAACVFGFVIIIYISMIKGAVNDSDYVRIIEGGVPTQIRAISFEMEKWASHIARDPRVIELVRQGKQTHESGGKKPGLTSMDAIRNRLEHRIMMKWRMLAEGPRPTELQITLAPGFTNLLWMNRPGLFGLETGREDSLQGESLTMGRPVSGFET
jgi:hypothetical protein